MHIIYVWNRIFSRMNLIWSSSFARFAGQRRALAARDDTTRALQNKLKSNISNNLPNLCLCSFRSLIFPDLPEPELYFPSDLQSSHSIFSFNFLYLGHSVCCLFWSVRWIFIAKDFSKTFLLSLIYFDAPHRSISRISAAHNLAGLVEEFCECRRSRGKALNRWITRIRHDNP